MWSFLKNIFKGLSRNKSAIWTKDFPLFNKNRQEVEGMDEMANANEMIRELAEENCTRKILAMAEKAKDKDEILEKLQATLEK